MTQFTNPEYTLIPAPTGSSEPEHWATSHIIEHYAVSTLGRVWSFHRDRLFSLIVLPNERLRVRLSKDGVMKDWFVHCLVARAFIAGRTQLRWSVNHIKGNPQNNRIENLEWATPKEQHDHANATGLHAKGSKVPTAKLTERAVMELVSDLNEGRLTQVELAALYGVTQSQVSAVKSGRSWAHLTGIVFTPVRKKRSGGTAPPAGREWRICRDFPAYLVSSLGELWSSYTNQVTLGSINHSGYLRVTVTAPAGKATQRQLHILVAREFVAGESDENNEVNNKDTNKKKNHISNLEWMSNPEQQNHAIRSGVHLKPSKKVPPLG